MTVWLQGRQPVTAITWGHNDRRIFVAVGCDVLSVVVLKRVASLQLLCGRRIQQRLVDESSIFLLPLPNKLQAAITELFTPTIKVKDARLISAFVSTLQLLFLFYRLIFAATIDYTVSPDS